MRLLGADIGQQPDGIYTVNAWTVRLTAVEASVTIMVKHFSRCLSLPVLGMGMVWQPFDGTTLKTNSRDGYIHKGGRNLGQQCHAVIQRIINLVRAR